MSVHFLGDVGRSLTGAGRQAMVQGIIDAGGRVVVGESITFKQNLVDGVSNAELLKSLGCDMVMINHYNMDMPMMPGIASSEEGIARFFALWNEDGSRGRAPRGCDLEPVFTKIFLASFGFGRTLGDAARLAGVPVGMALMTTEGDADTPPATLANAENGRRAAEHGAGFINLISTPSTSAADLSRYASMVREGYGENGLIKCGKMPWGGSFRTAPEGFYTEAEIRALSGGGADILIIPAPGTMQGFTIEVVKRWADIAHDSGLLVETTIGTSQEGADPDVIRRFAIDSKMAGADLQQIGDSVYNGLCSPQNVMAFAKAIKGERHTLRRMALSVLRGNPDEG